MLKSPETVTTFNIPVLAGFVKSDLNEGSYEATRDYLNIPKSEYKTLQSYDVEKLSDANKLYNKILTWYLEKQNEGENFFYQSYSFEHMTASAFEFPKFMKEDHKLEKKFDVEAYLNRLEKVPYKMKQLMTKDSIRVSKGPLPPDFIIDKTIEVLKNLIDSTDQNPLTSYNAKENILYTTLQDGSQRLKTCLMKIN